MTSAIEITQIINAATGKVTGSMKITGTFSGNGLAEAWAGIKASFPDDAVANDAKHTITFTQNMPEETISLSGLKTQGAQINQSGTKIRFPAKEGSPEMILSKQ